MNSNSIFIKKLLTIVLPIAFQQFMLALVSTSDALMLGALAQDSLSAVSLASQITFMENLFLGGMAIGMSMLGAQYWGKKDITSVEYIFAYVMKFTVTVSMLFFIAALGIPELLMRIFTNEQILIEGGAVYLRAASLSFLLTGISQVYLCMLKCSGQTTKASLISSVSVVLNIILNAILIFGLFGLPKLEIAGAALATVIARGVEVLWCVLETKKKDGIRLRWAYIVKTDVGLRHDFWKYTLPAMGNQIFWGVGFAMYSVIMGHLGSDAVAANSIATIVKNLVACFCYGLGNGGCIMVGHELGAGNLDTAKSYGSKLCKTAIICGIISGAIMVALIPVILMATDLTPQADVYLKWMVALCSYNMIGKALNCTTISGIFCAGGDSKFGFVCDTVTMWCFSVPIGFFVAFVLELPVVAVYFIINLDEIVKLPAVYKHYKKFRWVKDLTVK